MPSAQATPNPTTLGPTTNVPIDKFVLSEDALKTEIYWAMHNAVTRNSFRSARHANELFRNVFPNSKIVEKFMSAALNYPL